MTDSLPRNWRLERLGDCCEIVSGATPRREVPTYWSGSIPWVTPKDISDLDEPVFSDPAEGITEEGYRSCSTRLLPAGSILFSSRAPIGLVAIAGKSMCTNQGFKSIVPGTDLNSQYLYYCLKQLVPRIQAMGNGATFKEVSKEVMERVEIPLPPRRSDQERIAAILDKADTIRRKCRRGLAEGDKLLDAIFLDMFGDPRSALERWPKKKLGAMARRGDKVNYGVVVPGENVPSGIPIVRIGDFHRFGVNKTNLKRIDPKIENSYGRSRLHGDEILIACVGSVGEVVLADPSLAGFNIVRAVARVPLHEAYPREFVFSYLRSQHVKSYFARETRTVSQPTLNIRQIEDLDLPIPPRPLTMEFKERFLCVRQLGDRLEKEILEADQLFEAISHRAFLGEL